MFWRRFKGCEHEYYIEDIQLTGIKPPEKPESGYFEWVEYLQSLYTHESHTKRISCKCFKCGEVAFAHCGLDLKRIRRKPVLALQEGK